MPSRDLSWWLSRIVFGIWGVTLLWIGEKFLTPPAEELEPGVVVRVGEVQSLRPGFAQTVYVGETPVMLVRLADGEIRALQAVCTFRTCPLVWDPFDRVLVCPCHGERYDLNGNVLQGRASRGLTTYRVRVLDGVLWLYWRELP